MTMQHEIRNAAGMSGNVRSAAVNGQQSLLVSNDTRQWVKEGRVFSAGSGVLATPETGTATTLVRQTPNFMIRVPAGIVIVPLTGIIVPVATGAAVLQVLLSSCNNDPGTGNITEITATATTNVNTRFATTAPKTHVYNAGTGASGTAPTGVADLFRVYQQVDNDAITGAPTPPIVYNPRFGFGQETAIGSLGSINAFMAYYTNGTSSTWYSIFTWAEFTYDEYYS